MTQIKLPPCYDVSHWKEIPDFKKVEPRPVLFITKATEGHPGSPYNDTDDKFLRFFGGMMEIGVVRGAFHFFRKSLDSAAQARHFLNVIGRVDILPSDLLILDFEEQLTALENKSIVGEMWTWFNIVRHAYPDNDVLLYSRKNILDPIVMTASERTYFRDIWVWTAGWPFFPDLYSTVPKGYTPDPAKYGLVGLWQYAKIPFVQGIIGDVDLNLIVPAFWAILKKPELGDLIMASYEGTCKTTAKVWKTIGGERIYPDVRVGQSIKANGKQGDYLSLTSPIMGVSKAEWFDYHEVVLPPPPPPPANKTPFTLNVQGFKPYSGELEKL